MTAGWRQGLAWLREAGWDYLLGLAFFFVSVAFILGLGAESGALRGELMPLAQMAALGLLAAKLATGRYGGLRRMRLAAGRGAGRAAQLRELLPPFLVAWIHSDRANIGACLRWLAQRPHPKPPSGTNHPFLEKSAYGTMIVCGLVGILVELPLDGLIASVMTKDPVMRERLQYVLAFIAVYSLVWMMGDRWQMKGGYQVVGASELMLHVGGRLSARIPLPAITHCETMAESVSAWCKRNGVDATATLLCTPADSPNVAVGIDPSAGLRLYSWHVERDAPRYLLLFADDPSAMVRQLSERLKVPTMQENER